MLSVYQELAEPSRRAIMGELRTGPRNVSQIVAATGLKQPNVSNHLARLRERGVVRNSKVGREVYYALASPDIENAVRAVFAASSDEPYEIDKESLTRTYARAAVQGEEGVCKQVVEVMLRKRLPLIEIYQDVLAMAMGLVGTWYHVEAIDEAQEHMASEITLRMMSRVTGFYMPVKKNGKTAVIGCCAGNYHMLGLRMIGDYLDCCGWHTVFLGANVPTDAFLNTVREHEPELVMVSCTEPNSVEAALELVSGLAAMRGSRKPYRIAIGGRAAAGRFPEFEACGADFTAQDLRTLSDQHVPCEDGSPE